MSANWLWYVEVICFVLSVISLPLYILFLITLHKYRNQGELKSPFYRIMFSLGINDLALMFMFYLFQRSLYWNFFMAFHIWGGENMLKMWLVAIFGLQRSQYLTVLAAAFNRFTALVTPWKYEYVWNKEFTRKVIITSYVIGIVSVIYIPITCELSLGIVAERNRSWIKWSPALCFKATMGGTAIILWFLACLFIVLYTIMFVKVFKFKAKIAPNQSERAETRQKAGRNLAIVGFILSCLIIVQGLLFLFITVFPSRYYENHNFYQMMAAVEIVLFSMINPYLILCFCRKVRKKFVIVVKGMCGYTQISEAPTATPAGPSRIAGRNASTAF